MDPITKLEWQPIDERLVEWVYQGNKIYAFDSSGGLVYHLLHLLRRNNGSPPVAPSCLAFHLDCSEAEKSPSYARIYENWFEQWSRDPAYRNERDSFKAKYLEKPKTASVSAAGYTQQQSGLTYKQEILCSLHLAHAHIHGMYGFSQGFDLALEAFEGSLHAPVVGEHRWEFPLWMRRHDKTANVMWEGVLPNTDEQRQRNSSKRILSAVPYGETSMYPSANASGSSDPVLFPGLPMGAPADQVYKPVSGMDDDEADMIVSLQGLTVHQSYQQVSKTDDDEADLTVPSQGLTPSGSVPSSPDRQGTNKPTFIDFRPTTMAAGPHAPNLAHSTSAANPFIPINPMVYNDDAGFYGMHHDLRDNRQQDSLHVDPMHLHIKPDQAQRFELQWPKNHTLAQSKDRVKEWEAWERARLVGQEHVNPEDFLDYEHGESGEENRSWIGAPHHSSSAPSTAAPPTTPGWSRAAFQSAGSSDGSSVTIRSAGSGDTGSFTIQIAGSGDASSATIQIAGSGNASSATIYIAGGGNASSTTLHGTGSGNTSSATLHGTGSSNASSATLHGTRSGNTSSATLHGTGSGDASPSIFQSPSSGDANIAAFRGAGGDNASLATAIRIDGSGDVFFTLPAKYIAEDF
ncbi:hypothetical protein LTR66_005915 [Elasticomyces elasticus]|nr:hypothetical protein LTR66_005915 [Elasticomyces elasticus]